MNVLADFLVRVEEQYPESIDNEELNSLLLTIRNQAAEISSLKKEVTSLRTDMENKEENLPAPVEAVEEKPKKAAKAKAAPKAKATKTAKAPKAAKADEEKPKRTRKKAEA